MVNEFMIYLQAFNYQGENMLSQDKCGEAIRSLQESQRSKNIFNGIFLEKCSQCH